MLVSVDWIADYLPQARAIEDLSHLFTDHGLEVESTAAAGPDLPGIVAARVAESKKIAGAGGALLCSLKHGSDRHSQVVCAAPNVGRRGLYAFAPAGTSLPDGRKIEAVRLHGHLSEGMLCSASELALGDDSSGLLRLDRGSEPGAPLTRLLALDDRVYDLAITPNRGDWLSMRGVARELAALLKLRIRPLPTKIPAGSKDAMAVTISPDAAAACPRFCALPISGVNAGAATPLWMRERLRRCGVRPVSAIVDITNYVMLAVGQPLHAFDRDRLGGAIQVRFARSREQLELLDATAARLGEDMLLVCGDDQPAAIAGVMGGRESGVTAATGNIVLEAAHFAPAAIRGRARTLNLNSEAAFRFERGVDPALPVAALAAAARLVKRICGGRIGALTEAGAAPVPGEVELADGKVEKLLGFSPRKSENAAILRRLGCTVASKRQALLARPPSWRFDIERAEDLVEEIVRVLGYESVPTTMPEFSGRFLPCPEPVLAAAAARQHLAAEGFFETVTFSFVPPAWEKDFYGSRKPLILANPLSEEASAMRSGLLASLVDCAAYNFSHSQRAVRIFELSRCFPANADSQPRMLAALACGPRLADHWDGCERPFDFFDIKAVLVRLLSGCRIGFQREASHPALHPGKAARVMLADRQIGLIGEIHPQLADRCCLPHPAAAFEIDFDAAAALMRRCQAQPQSRLPLVRRDLAVEAAADIEAGQLVESILMLAIPEIFAVDVFDVYAGEQIGAGKKSVGLRISMQGAGENLIDERIDAIVDAAAGALEKNHATIRRSKR